MQSDLLSAKVVHLHLTRRCNFACSHCYSASSPAEKDIMSVRKIELLLTNLKIEGYKVLSLSGGEPLLFKHFRKVTQIAKNLGYIINVITNGTYIDKLITNLKDTPVDHVAVSLDGDKDAHNKIRGNQRAFNIAISALKKLCDTKIGVSISYSVSKLSIPDLPKIIDVAEMYGVKHIQLHPVIAIGRAQSSAQELLLDQNDRERLFVLSQVLARYGADINIKISCDLIPSQWIKSGLKYNVNTSGRMSEKINPIVIDESGKLFPFAYGVHPNLEISYDRNSSRSFKKMDSQIEQIFTMSVENNTQKYTDWYENFVKHSYTYARKDFDVQNI